jgi:hypothetical protein
VFEENELQALLEAQEQEYQAACVQLERQEARKLLEKQEEEEHQRQEARKLLENQEEEEHQRQEARKLLEKQEEQEYQRQEARKLLEVPVVKRAYDDVCDLDSGSVASHHRRPPTKKNKTTPKKTIVKKKVRSSSDSDSSRSSSGGSCSDSETGDECAPKRKIKMPRITNEERSWVCDWLQKDRKDGKMSNARWTRNGGAKGQTMTATSAEVKTSGAHEALATLWMRLFLYFVTSCLMPAQVRQQTIEKQEQESHLDQGCCQKKICFNVGGLL